MDNKDQAFKDISSIDGQPNSETNANLLTSRFAIVERMCTIIVHRVITLCGGVSNVPIFRIS